MPEGSGGDFDGDGSVRWEVITEEDDDGKGGSEPNPPIGRKSRGADKKCKTYFRVVMKVPEDPEKRQTFLAQFNVPATGGEVEVRLPIEKVRKQIKVRWDADGPVDLKGREKGA